MKASKFYISTFKEAPAEAELTSHKLMIRAGLIKKLGSGLYTWMPMGLRVLKKIENTIREEMQQAGAVELLMPAIQPAELWEETGRWELFGHHPPFPHRQGPCGDGHLVCVECWVGAAVRRGIS